MPISPPRAECWPILVKANAGDFALRPVMPSDEAAYLAYWHDGIADLDFLGIDPTKLGAREDSQARFTEFCSERWPRLVLGYCITSHDEPVGFLNVNVLGRARGVPHFHLTNPAARRSGLMTAVLATCLAVILDDVYEQSGADGFTVEVRTRNVGMNTVLQRLGHRVVATRELSAPDGLAGPGVFNLYEIDRASSD